MKLHLAAAIGRARTDVAASDAARLAAGVGDLNVVPLSWIIPPGTEIVPTERCPPAGDGSWGDRLYAVCAERRVRRPGEQAWAGIGWVQDRCHGHGLLAAHDGPTERAVRSQIRASLEDVQTARGAALGPIRIRVVGATCTGLPTCALVTARSRPSPGRTGPPRPPCRVCTPSADAPASSQRVAVSVGWSSRRRPSVSLSFGATCRCWVGMWASRWQRCSTLAL